MCIDHIVPACVAGTKVPALIERRESGTSPARPSRGVAGTKVPALIERRNRRLTVEFEYIVLPELKFRPSLSEVLPGRVYP